MGRGLEGKKRGIGGEGMEISAGEYLKYMYLKYGNVFCICISITEDKKYFVFYLKYILIIILYFLYMQNTK